MFRRCDRPDLIGVYKRALRVGHALCARGHDVFFSCTGRENYRDDMTERAEQRMEFLDWPWMRSLHEGAEYNRQQTLAALRRAAPDVVVIGEAPLAGCDVFRRALDEHCGLGRRAR